MKHIKVFEENKLPSHFQIKDVVDLDFGRSGKLTGCRIYEVHFDEEKVTYDIEVMINFSTKEGSVTIIKDVDSTFVKEQQ